MRPELKKEIDDRIERLVSMAVGYGGGMDGDSDSVVSLTASQDQTVIWIAAVIEREAADAVRLAMEELDMPLPEKESLPPGKEQE